MCRLLVDLLMAWAWGGFPTSDTANRRLIVKQKCGIALRRRAGGTATVTRMRPTEGDSVLMVRASGAVTIPYADAA